MFPDLSSPDCWFGKRGHTSAVRIMRARTPVHSEGSSARTRGTHTFCSAVIKENSHTGFAGCEVDEDFHVSSLNKRWRVCYRLWFQHKCKASLFFILVSRLPHKLLCFAQNAGGAVKMSHYYEDDLVKVCLALYQWTIIHACRSQTLLEI